MSVSRHNPFSEAAKDEPSETDPIGDLARFDHLARVKPKISELKHVAQQARYDRPLSSHAPGETPGERYAATDNRYRTGRNQQLNLRVSAEDAHRFDEIAAQFGWIKGQMLSYALDALEVQLRDPASRFWADKGIIPKSR